MTGDFRLDRSVPNYAVFGNPIKHSKSPRIHSLFAKQTGLDLHYQSIEVPTDKFNKYVDLFASQGGLGLNITVPFKEEAYSFCSSLTQRAELCGSVNTIRFDEALNSFGDTTDGQGFINDLRINHQINVKDKAVLILGAGGSIKAILEPLCQEQPAHIIIANRTVSRAEELVDKFSEFGKITACSYSDISPHPFDLVINGTSLSLIGELPAVTGSVINKNTCCYDLMYSDTATVFMQWATDLGAVKVMDGLGMLVEQAAESFLIWHGVKPQTMTVINALRK
ncbi:MAG: shikimate dehydrogenase (NADP(+)) [marine bacterium B5-7]|nr:MAG: shikimate dehydrogenase (NADP(+)) [marine bacterium B5-7]